METNKIIIYRLIHM